MITRKTLKVLSKNDSSQKSRPDNEAVAEHRETILSAIAAAGWAPFHYDRRIDEIAEPWRFYWLDHECCRSLCELLPTLPVSMKPGNKIPMMLEACSSLLIATWLPDSEISDDEKRCEVNEEHLAAASAAVQNLLLALTARGCGTYWSSGGVLREGPVRERLGIPSRDRFLAAVFVDDIVLRGNYSVELIPGKNREKRSPASKWYLEVKLPRAT